MRVGVCGWVLGLLVYEVSWGCIRNEKAIAFRKFWVRFRRRVGAWKAETNGSSASGPLFEWEG